MRSTVSILIPTHNRRELLVRTLDSLHELDVDSATADVEVIVVANACTDGTEAAVAERAASHPLGVRCAVEPTPGLNPARNAAMREAAGDVLAFLDDDVWVDSAWLRELLRAYRETDADIVGGRVELWWEAVRRPDWIGPEMDFVLSGTAPGDATVELHRPMGIIGANFTLRRRVVERIGGFAQGVDRRGGELLGGGEIEFLYRALGAGFRAAYAPRALVKHWVAPDRIEPDYLTRVAYNIGMGNVYIKPSFGPAQVARQFLGRPYLIVRHGAGELFARARGDRRGWIHHRAARMVGQGGLVATVRRLSGRSPRGAAPPPESFARSDRPARNVATAAASQSVHSATYN
jgi:GT2 family glycosyltransferase